MLNVSKQCPPYVYFHLALKHCGSSPIDAIAQVSAVAETSKLLELLSDLQSEGTVRRLQNVSCLPLNETIWGLLTLAETNKYSLPRHFLKMIISFSLEHGAIPSQLC